MKPLLYDSALTCSYSTVYLESFFITMEVLPLNVLDFGFQRLTGPSSGVVASIL